MASEIQAFSLASYAFIFSMALRRAVKILSSLVGVVGGLKWSRLRPPSYLECSLREVLWTQPSII